MITFRSLQREDWDWFHPRTNVNPSMDSTGVVAVDEAGDIQAMCIMDSWTYTSVQIHQAIDNPMVLRHGYLEEITNFVFNISDRMNMIALVPSDNEKAIKLNKKIGFNEEYRIKNGYNYGVDFVVMIMTPETCNYLPNKEAA